MRLKIFPIPCPKFRCQSNPRINVHMNRRKEKYMRVYSWKDIAKRSWQTSAVLSPATCGVGDEQLIKLKSNAVENFNWTKFSKILWQVKIQLLENDCQFGW